MLYLLSLVLIVTTVCVCVLKSVLDRLHRLERELKESHQKQVQVCTDLEKLFTEQIAAVHDLANKAHSSTNSFGNRIEEMNNKVVALSLKR